MIPSSDRPRLRVAAGVLGAIVGLLGLTVVVAWYVHAVELIQPLPAIAPQPFNAALCFLLAGAGLVLLVARRRRWAVAMAAAIALVAFVTLIEHWTQFALGIDGLFFRQAAPGGAAATRMAIESAYGFAALALLMAFAALATWRRRCVIVGLGGGVIFALSGTVLIGHVVGLPGAYLWPGLMGLSVHTAAEFMAAGGGFVLLAWDEELRAGVNVSAWRAVSVSVGAAVLMLGLWHALRALETRDAMRANQLVAGQVEAQLRLTVDGHVRSMRRQAAQWQLRAPSRSEWEADARLSSEGSALPSSFHWVDAHGVAQWHVHESDADTLNVQPVAITASHVPWLELARRKELPIYVGPVELAPGRAGFYVVVPVGRSGTDDGYLMGAFDLSRFVAELPDAVVKEFSIALREGERTWATRGAPPAPGQQPLVARLDLGDMRWSLRLTPTHGPNLALSWVVALMGLVVSGVLAWLVHLGETAERRSRQLETIIDSSPVGMILMQPAGRIVRVNETACALFGYASQEPVGHSIEMLVPAARRERHVQLRSDFLATHEGKAGTNLEVPAQRRDGSCFTVDIGISTVKLDDDWYVLAIVRDITARHEAQVALREREAELARSNQDLEQFAYVASHDLRAPLRAVDHLSQWMIQDLDPHMSDEQRENGQLLRRRVQRMDRLLSDLLEYARVTRVHKEAETVDTADLLDDVIAMLDWPQGFTLLRAPGLPVFDTNRTALRVVFANLVGNVVKHHDRPEGTVAVDWRDADAFHEFRVSDDGPGIPPRYHAKAFEMFQTLRPRDEVEGSGMGLALAKRLIESRGGTIEIEASDTRGTTFRFTWPKEWKGGSTA